MLVPDHDEGRLGSANLLTQVHQRTQAALACGALQPIETHYTFIEQRGIRFLLRILANVERKVKVTHARRQKDPNFNPFLPYDPELWVGDFSATHVCLLNKFNVVADHILIVTQAFEPQTHWLTIADFDALAFGLNQIDGLGFYNGGTAAGASQPHKHLQLVPFPMLPNGEPLPIEKAIATLSNTAPVLNPLSLFPFHHALVRLPEQLDAQVLHNAYQQALVAVQLSTPATVLAGTQTGAYNLLVTRQWLLLVPRQQDEWEDISVNSLGFAGTLFVKNVQQQARLVEIGPLELLKAVAIAR
ncbi:MAG: phosphorylase [Spirulina sp. SIO3F2]|nr:phosphorylase [Spirulina sp. SIO3F2]